MPKESVLPVGDVCVRHSQVDRPVKLASLSPVKVEIRCHLEAVHRLCLVLNGRADAWTTCDASSRFDLTPLDKYGHGQYVAQYVAMERSCLV